MKTTRALIVATCLGAAVAWAAPAARAETFHVAPHGDDGGDGSEGAPFRTLGHACAGLGPGDALLVQDGDYDEPVDPAASGTAEEPIVIGAAPGARPVVRGAIDVRGRRHLVVEGLHLVSDGSADYARFDDGSAHVTVEGCTFETIPEWTSAYFGIHLRGSYLTIRSCAFLGNVRGDVIRADGDHVLIEGNDFSLARGGHGMLNASATYLVIRGNYLTNPWDRISSITWNVDRELPCHHVLIEDNVYFDGNYDGLYPVPPEFTGEDNTPGSYYSGFRIMARDVVIRNNIFAGMNHGKGDPIATHSTITMVPWEKTPHVEQLRIYHNTVYANAEGGLGVGWGHDSVSWQDIRFLNNLVYDVLEHALSVAPADGQDIPLEALRFEGNLLFEPSTDLTVYLYGDSLTVAEAEAAHPEVFVDNIVAEPTFASPASFDAAEADESRQTRLELTDLALVEGSAGRGEGRPLSRVARATTAAATLAVDDALCFSDGLGLVDGDELLIVGPGGESRTRVRARVDEHLLEVDPPVTVALGDEVYLARWGSAPDVGAMAASEEPEECEGEECDDGPNAPIGDGGGDVAEPDGGSADGGSPPPSEGDGGAAAGGDDGAIEGGCCCVASGRPSATGTILAAALRGLVWVGR